VRADDDRGKAEASPRRRECPRHRGAGRVIGLSGGSNRPRKAGGRASPGGAGRRCTALEQAALDRAWRTGRRVPQGPDERHKNGFSQAQSGLMGACRLALQMIVWCRPPGAPARSQARSSEGLRFAGGRARACAGRPIVGGTPPPIENRRGRIGKARAARPAFRGVIFPGAGESPFAANRGAAEPAWADNVAQPDAFRAIRAVPSSTQRMGSGGGEIGGGNIGGVSVAVEIERRRDLKRGGKGGHETPSHQPDMEKIKARAEHGRQGERTFGTPHSLSAAVIPAAGKAPGMKIEKNRLIATGWAPHPDRGAGPMLGRNLPGKRPNAGALREVGSWSERGGARGQVARRRFRADARSDGGWAGAAARHRPWPYSRRGRGFRAASFRATCDTLWRAFSARFRRRRLAAGVRCSLRLHEGKTGGGGDGFRAGGYPAALWTDHRAGRVDPRGQVVGTYRDADRR